METFYVKDLDFLFISVHKNILVKVRARFHYIL